MDESHAWDVDRLAAQSLLAGLKIETTPDLIEAAAVHLARYRETSTRWIVERVRSRIAALLEDRAMQSLDRRSEDWARGVWFAQEQIVGMNLYELIDQPAGQAQTRGQVLRAMVRKARDEAAIVRRLPRHS